MMPAAGYRPEIDGLRAVAVLAVIAHHLVPTRLPGGYVGVDVFFVISGYLIGHLVLDAVRQEHFSLVEFWGRRAKRLLPALLPMLCTSAIAAGALLNTYEQRQFWASMGSAALSLSNVFFWRQTDYFAPEAAHMPLLHTWSLAVEEQFYLLFPLLALALSRCADRARNRLWMALLCGGCVLAALLWCWRPIMAFYLLPARLFELLAGIVLATRAPSKPSAPAVSDRLCLMALLLLLVLAFTEATSSLGRFAHISLAVGSAAWLITGLAAGGFTTRLLASAPARLVGRASYSLYLWHLPLLVFVPLLLPSTPPVLLLMATLLAGWISHVAFEQPLRHARWLSPKMALCCGVGLSLFCAGYAGLRYSWYGLPQRPSQDQQTLLAASYDFARDYELGRCFIGPDMTVDALRTCPASPAQGSPSVLLWGDSHAAHLYPGLKPLPGVSLTRWAVAGCAPLLSLTSRFRPDCAEVNETLLARATALQPDVVVLAADWIALDPSSIDLAPVIARLRGAGARQVIVVGPVPRWQQPLSYLMAEHSAQLATMPERLNTGLDPRAWLLDQQLARQARALGADYLSALGVFCNDAGCLTREAPGSAELSSWDQAHLRPAASRRLADALVKRIATSSGYATDGAGR